MNAEAFCGLTGIVECFPNVQNVSSQISAYWIADATGQRRRKIWEGVRLSADRT